MRTPTGSGRPSLLRRLLPHGGSLPEAAWELRHRWVVGVLLVQALVLPLVAATRYGAGSHMVPEAATPLLLVAVAVAPRLSRTLRSVAASTGLMLVSGIVVHLSGGLIEAHFHFFVMIAVVALYESWLPFGAAVAFVLVHHGVIGTMFSHAVYNHAGAQQRPWLWAGVHAVVFALACLGSIVNWRLHEGARDVERRLHDDLATRARTDDLTRLANRPALLTEGARLVARALATGTPLSVLVLDLDRFKIVNDTLGHAWGDALLQQVGPRLALVLRERDVLARLGGDEFAVLLPDVTAEVAHDVAERLRGQLAEGFVVDGIELDVDGSVGIAVLDPAGASPRDTTVDDLLRHADVAMYEAKRSGAGTARYSQRDDANSRTRLSLLSDLRRAVQEEPGEGRQLLLHFQPKLDLQTGAVTGAEALVRWRHPARGLLMPGDFIPEAESSGLVVPLTQRVLELALRQARRWWDSGYHLQVAVNVPPRCLADPAFVDRVRGQLSALGLPGEALRVEVTESSLLEDPAAALATMTRLADLGVGLSIDDFGTGYSSLSHLRQLPVDELKVDRSFTLGMTSSDDDAAIVRSAVELGHRLGLSVVAEGVEDQQTLDALTDTRCDTAQGYHFARPMPAVDVDRWLRSRPAGRSRPTVPPPRRAAVSATGGKRSTS